MTMIMNSDDNADSKSIDELGPTWLVVALAGVLKLLPTAFGDRG